MSRADSLWRKLFSVKGEAPEPVPVVSVTDEPPELRVLNGWRPYMDSIGVTGDATHKGQIVLQFPTGVGNQMVAVIERMEILYTPAAVGSPIKIGWAGSVGVVSGNAGKTRDTRLPLIQTGQLVNQAFTNQADLFVVAIDVYPVNVTATQSVHQPILVVGEQIVLTSAGRLVIATSANAETLQLRYTWRERPLEPSEINPL